MLGATEKHRQGKLQCIYLRVLVMKVKQKETSVRMPFYSLKSNCRPRQDCEFGAPPGYTVGPCLKMPSPITNTTTTSEPDRPSQAQKAGSMPRLAIHGALRWLCLKHLHLTDKEAEQQKAPFTECNNASSHHTRNLLGSDTSRCLFSPLRPGHAGPEAAAARRAGFPLHALCDHWAHTLFLLCKKERD